MLIPKSMKSCSLAPILYLENNLMTSLFLVVHLCTFSFTLRRHTADAQQDSNKGNSSNCTKKLD